MAMTSSRDKLRYCLHCGQKCALVLWSNSLVKALFLDVRTAPHLDKVTDYPRYSLLLADFSSVGGNVIYGLFPLKGTF